MWREDDFDDNSKNIKAVPRDWAEEVIDHTDFEPEANAEPRPLRRLGQDHPE